MCIWSLSLSKNLTILHSPSCDEMIKDLCDKVKWGERHTHWDPALGYYCPSDNMSGGWSASGLWLTVGNWNCRKQPQR